jgi:hypothetical protein
VDEKAAPGGLEQVRAFINTWLVPNDTRVPEDRLPELVADPARWRAELPGVPPDPGDPGDLGELVRLREALRRSLGLERPVELDGWLRRHPLRAEIPADPDAPPLALRPETAGPIGHILALAAEAIRAGQWARLKACPDCKWVFYDHSRNGGRRWCAMTAGSPYGRGCGSIAKVRSYRERKRV